MRVKMLAMGTPVDADALPQYLNVQRSLAVKLVTSGR
jgi:hypothetical protein